MRHTPGLRRFPSERPDPTQVLALSADHPAVTEGRTLFPSTVTASLDSPRFLVSGHSNPKLGKAVIKGPRAGWPIFQLSLEERATCPRSCEQWRDCYGSAMPFARRHRVDEHFLPLLRAEVATLARQHPKGLLVRLHALGDFYSAEYVLAWAEMLAQFPQLHVFGYTARTVLDSDPESAKTARAIEVLTDKAWDRFAIRTSTSLLDVANSRAIVVDADPEEPDTIVCPAQTQATEACATCGLCWAANARGKTIAFLRHGMVRPTGPRKAASVVELRPAVKTPPEPQRKPPEAKPGRHPAGRVAEHHRDEEARLLGALEALAGQDGKVTASLKVLSDGSGIPHGSVLFVVRRLAEAGKIEVIRNGYEGGKKQPNSYRVIGDAPPPPAEPVEPEPKPEPTPEPAPSRSGETNRLHAWLAERCDPDGYVEAVRGEVCRDAGFSTGSWHYMVESLVKADRLVVARTGQGGRPTLYRVLDGKGGPICGTAPLLLPQEPADRPAKLEPIELPEEPAGPGPRTLLKLRPGLCHWPVGEPDPEQFYCADPCEPGKEYCADHASAMFASHRKGRA